MALKMIEIFRESRKFEVTRRSVTKDFVFLVEDDEFLEYANTQEVPDADLVLYLDDDVMQRRVLPYFISIIPVNYQFFLNENGDYVFLYAATVRAEQINWKTWKLFVTFDIPDDNGQSQGGGGGESGPANGEDVSQEFTQFTFNCTAVFEKRQMGYLIESQRRIGLPGTAALTPGKYQPIGETDDGIEGAEQPVRSFTFEIVQYMSPRKLTYQYKRRLSRLVTSINLDDFFGNAPGSVMCVGANATGHLYQNVPVSLQFEIRPNFRWVQSGLRSIASLQDTYYTTPGNKKRVLTSTQYDTYVDSTFPSTTVNHAAHSVVGVNPLPLPNGVHSGWAILAYRYDKEIKTTEKVVVRRPSDRYIYMPEETTFMNFSEFLL